MKKSDVISVLAVRENLSSAEAKRILQLIFDGFKDALARGERIEIRGFGNFAMRDYGTYKGRNPRTGGEVEVKPKRMPFFKVGRELKGRVNGFNTQKQ